MLVKIEEAREILESKGEREALRFASRLKCLGEARDDIQKAYSALSNPRFYQQLGLDPDTLVKQGIARLKQLIATNS